MLRVRRIHDRPERADGTRVLVDRVWPRGIRKADAAIDHWFRDIAPSTALRKWFGHDPQRWDAFRERYFAELDAQPERVAELRRLARGRTVTLLFAARDTEHNNAVALRQYLQGKRRR